MKSKAFVNGVEITVYDFQGDKVKCFVQELGITAWYRLNQIEVKLI